MTDPIPLSRKGRLICFSVRLQPGAGRGGLTGVVEGALRIRVAVPPVDNRANQEMVAFLAGLLGVTKRQVQLIGGHKSRLKKVCIEGLDEEELRDRLRAVLERAGLESSDRKEGV